MIESETPPLVPPSYEAGDLEVSSRRAFLSPDPGKGRRTSPAHLGARSKGLQDLLERAYLRRTPRVDGHGEWKDFILGERIV